MHKKNGFTLIEIIAVIIILAIITVIATVSFTAIRKKTLQKDYESLIRNINIAAEKYVADKAINKNCTLTVNNLLTNGYIESNANDSDVVDPRDKNKKLNDYKICITKDTTNKYVATYNGNCSYSTCN